MLTKKQLQDASNCEKMECKKCSMNDVCYETVFSCTNALAQTALAYREMLERLETVLKQARAALKECAEISSFDGLYRVASIAEDAIQAIDEIDELEGSEWER